MRFSVPARLALAAVLALAGAGCSAPPTDTSARDGAAAVGAQRPDADTPPGASTPIPSAAPAAPAVADQGPSDRGPVPVTVDYSCRVDADCAVKNVGNCCGAMPACVNRSSPTDPAAVQAECQRRGLSSVCGFPEVTSCSCVDNRCTAGQGAVAGWMQAGPAGTEAAQ